MELLLTNAGYENEKNIEVDIKDIVKVFVYEIGTLVGTVEAVTQDYLSLRNITLIKPLYPETILNLKNPTIFYNDEIYRISVIGKRCNVKPLRLVN